MILFYALIVSLALPEHPLLATGLGEWTLIKLLGAACLVYALTASALKQRWPNLVSTIPARFALAYVIVTGLSCVFRDAGQEGGVVFVFKELAVVMLLISTVLLLDSAKRVRHTVLVLFGALALASIYVIRQYVAFRDVYEGFRTWGGVSGDPNYFALAVVLWIPVCTLWLTNKRRSRLERLYCGGCLGVIGVAFVLTGSRGGFLGLAASLVTLTYRMRVPLRIKLFGAVGVGAVLILLILVPSSPLHRLVEPSGGDRQSSEYRLLLWKCGMQVVAENPVFGVGFANVPAEIAKRGAPAFKAVHNTYVEAAAGLGLTGVATFVALLISTIHMLGIAASRLRSANRRMLADLAAGLQSGFVGYSVCAFFLSTWWHMMVWLALSVALALLQLTSRLPRRDRTEKARSAALEPLLR